MAVSKEQLFEALVDGGGVAEKEFNLALKSRDVKRMGVEGVLIARGLIRDDQIGQLLAEYFGIKFVRLGMSNVSPEILKLIPEGFARKQSVIPISKKGEDFILAVKDPTNVQLLSLLEKYLRGNVIFVLATKKDIEASMASYQKNPAEAMRNILEVDTQIDEDGEDGEGDGTRIIKFVEAVIEYAYQEKTSDVHIEPEGRYTQVRYRIDGVLHDIYEMPKKFHESMITRLKVLSRLAIDEHRAAQDGKISYVNNWGDKIEIRLSIVPTTNGEKAVMRLLSDKVRQFSLSDLGLGDSDHKKINEAIKRPWGMMLVTGPTGSGKTTTLYAALKILNKREVNIATIEDPVEYDMEGVNQIQVNSRTNLTFAKGLRSIVRQDPDIIMVGEIRDAETADISINASLTGHLVFSSLHTNDASTAFPRLKDMGIEDFLISSTIVVVMAQRLVRKVCLSCIKSYIITSKEIEYISHYPEVEKTLKLASGKKKLKGIRLFKGDGCANCAGTGYSGRTGIFEVLIVSDNIREAIMKNKNADEIRATAIKEGMNTMLKDGVDKIITGITTIEELLRVAQQ